MKNWYWVPFMFFISIHSVFAQNTRQFRVADIQNLGVIWDSTAINRTISDIITDSQRQNHTLNFSKIDGLNNFEMQMVLQVYGNEIPETAEIDELWVVFVTILGDAALTVSEYIIFFSLQPFEHNPYLLWVYRAFR